MATFVGDKDEFHRFVGPRIRNAVNLFAQKGRLARNGICEHCNRSDQIQDSAHVTGRGRRHFIDLVIERYTSGGTVRCSIEDVENEIIDAHGDVADAFKFLCKPCHREYDRAASITETESSISPQPISADEHRYTRLKLTFIPSNERDFQNELVKHQKARITLRMQDGRTETKLWSAKNLRNESNLRSNLSSGYFRDWKIRGIVEGIIEIIYD